MYEALKAGIIGNVELYTRLAGSSIRELRSDNEFLSWVIAESVKLKAQVVSADEKESDLRRVLNLGHTLGHALEAATDYRHFLHGEAVAWGIEAAARIALEIQLCEKSVYESILHAIHAWGPLPQVNVQSAKALKLILSDKKAEAGTVHFVLPTKIGEVKVVNGVPPQAISSALAEIRRASRA
jgi:3-dehydroquinate synthase